MAQLTVLVDNNTDDSLLANQHGLSLWVSTGRSKILFDTGQDGLFLKNAKALGVSVETATHLVLSHCHYDHTGGVPYFLNAGVSPIVVAHADSWTERRSVHKDGTDHSIGIPWPKELLAEHHLNVIFNKNVYCIESGINVVRVASFADVIPKHPNLHRLVNGVWMPDDFPDEQILVLKTTEGLVVISGCTHCGVAALIECLRNFAGNVPIYALVGGLHLVNSSREQILASAELLRDIKHIGVNHCTGDEAYSVLHSIFDRKIRRMGAGAQIDLPELEF